MGKLTPHSVANTFDLQGLIDTYWEKSSSPYKSSNIGASQIGCLCNRSLYLSFRWATGKESVKGQMLRLFDLGTREEDVMADNLIKIGCKLKAIGKDQLKLSIAPHVVSKPDGIIEEGPFDMEDGEVINWESKTMNRSNFDKVQKQGCKLAKPEHYTQAQLEMHGERNQLGLNVTRTLYTVLCKDDSRIYAEWLEYDEGEVSKALKKAEIAIFSGDLPLSYCDDPEIDPCRFCDHSVFCYVSRETKEVNCRTCAWSSPKEDGTWHCSIYEGEPIPYEAQLKGCPCHSFNPSLVPYPQDKEKTQLGVMAFKKKDGSIVYNGYGNVPSSELWLNMIPQEQALDGADPLDITF